MNPSQELYILISMKVKKVKPQMGRPREFDVDKALDKAMHVFWRKGYLGASITDLCQTIGINRPSLYAAFGDKESLFKKVMERYLKGPACFLVNAVNEPTALGVAEKILRGVVCRTTDPKNPRGCLWVHGVLSCGDPADPIHKEMSAQRAKDEVFLAQRFTRAIAEGDLPADSDPAALARLILTTIEGLAVQAQTGVSHDDMMKVVDLILKAWPTAR